MRNDNLFFTPKLPLSLNQGLVAYYSFDGNNANDLIGGNNGTLVGSPTFTSGINNNAIDFGNDNTLRYVYIPDSNSLSFTDGVNDLPFSISMWVNFSSFSSTGNWLINKRNSTNGGDEWQLTRADNTLGFSKFDKNANSIIQNIRVSPNWIPSFSTWYHIVITDNGTKNVSGMKLYINDILQTITDNSVGTYTGMNNGAASTAMGNAAWAPSLFLKHRGLIDEVAIWRNRKLTQSEVTELYNSGIGKFYPF